MLLISGLLFMSMIKESDQAVCTKKLFDGRPNEWRSSSGKNIDSFGGYWTLSACKAKCQATPSCEEFRIKKNSKLSYSGCVLMRGGNTYSGQLTSSFEMHKLVACSETTTTPPPTPPPIKVCWKHLARACVSGHNLKAHPSKTVSECKALCINEPKCKSFEYGVSHGGPTSYFKPGDCRLQSGSSPEGCDGGKLNLDLYIKGCDETTTSAPTSPPGIIVDGQWGAWGPYSTCTKTCGTGTQRRTRSCDNPKASIDGRNCQGDAVQQTSCNVQPCSVAGQWGSWSESRCSRMCKEGYRSRRRLCDSPAASYGGAKCPGKESEQTQCEEYKDIDCPDGWMGIRDERETFALSLTQETNEENASSAASFAMSGYPVVCFGLSAFLYSLSLLA